MKQDAFSRCHPVVNFIYFALAIGFGVVGLYSTSFGVGWVIVANLIASVVTFAFSYLIQRVLTRKVKTLDMVASLKSVE